MLRSRSVKLIAGMAAAALALAACGSNTPAAQSTTSQPPATSPAMSTSPSSEAPSGSETPSSSSAAPTSPSGGETGGGATIGDASKAKVGLAYDIGGRGDQSFNDSAARGLDKAKAAGVQVIGELEANGGEAEAAKLDRLEQLASKGANVILGIGFAYQKAINEVAPKHPDIAFGIIDDSANCEPGGEAIGLKNPTPIKNVACLTFAEEQGSYLVGLAAGLKSTTGHVGFIGGVNVPLIQKFDAGFAAGAKAAKADIKLDSKYITEPPDFAGFNDPAKGETIAKGMYDGGADIIYAAAGGSGAGVFKAAKAAGKSGIGVDSDQYNLPSLADVKDVIITSMVKNVDVAVFDMIASVTNSAPLTGSKVYDLKVGGVGYATSGGKVDDIKDKLEEAKAKIISGEIKVPSTIG